MPYPNLQASQLEYTYIPKSRSSSDSKHLRTRKRTVPFHFQKSLVTFLVAVITITLTISPASGTITVISQTFNESVLVFEDRPASFVPDRVSAYGMQGYAVYANPANACTTVDKPPLDYYPVNVNWILVARRYGCDFQMKIENAQEAGYAAIIVHNVGSNETEAMGADNPSKLYIYACFIGEYHGQLLENKYSYPNLTYYIRIQDDFTMNGYLLPFAIVVGVCFIIMLIFMVRLLWQQVARWIRDRRRSRRRKLPSSALKKLPVNKWTKGDPYETCAICLEDFVEQDKVRVLPCSHGYHTVCIDPWLTKGRRVCPICKRKVILADERFPFSESDTEDETTPLLGPSGAPIPTSSNGTFIQRENPFRRAHRRAHREQHRNSATHNVAISDSDSVSTTESEGSNDGSGSRILRHHSLPVLAQVHNTSPLETCGVHVQHNLVMTGSEVNQSSLGDANIGATDTPSSQSQFYVSFQEEPDEGMLQVTTVTVLPYSHSAATEITVEVPTVLVLESHQVQVQVSTPGAGSASESRNTIV